MRRQCWLCVMSGCRCRHRAEAPVPGVHDPLAVQPGAFLQAQRRRQAPARHRHPGQAHHHDHQRETDVPLHPGQDLGQSGTGTSLEMHTLFSCTSN